jgi:hypothetical protein
MTDRGDFDEVKMEIAALRDVNQVTEKRLTQQDEALAKILAAVTTSKVGPVQAPNMPMDTRQWQEPMRGGGGNTFYGPRGGGNRLSCFFCMGEHLLNDCIELLDYIQQGLLMKDPKDGRIKLPDGAGIPGTGPGWKRRVDDYWKQKGPPNAKNLFYGEEEEAVDKVALYQTEVRRLQGQLENLKMAGASSSTISQGSPSNGVDYKFILQQVLALSPEAEQGTKREGF